MQSVRADGVERDVCTAHSLAHGLLGVVHVLVGAQTQHEVAVACGAGADRPDTSIPSTLGSGALLDPRRFFQSAGLTDGRWTLISTSPSPGSGPSASS